MARNTKTTRTARTTKSRTARTAKPTVRRSRKAAAPVATGTTISYPFTSKAQILARIQGSPQEALNALCTVNELDAAMSSQKKLVADLAAEIGEAGKGAADNKDLVSRATAVAARYVRRLAKHERTLALKSNPELKQFVKMFSATTGS